MPDTSGVRVPLGPTNEFTMVGKKAVEIDLATITRLAGFAVVAPASGSISAKHYSADGVNITTKLTLVDAVMTLTRTSASITSGSLSLCTMPTGWSLLESGYLNLTGDVVTNLAGLASQAVIVSVGTAAAGVDNATLTTTEANVIASDSATLDGDHDGAWEVASFAPAAIETATIRLNAASAADSTSSGTYKFSGTIEFSWKATNL